MPLQSTSDPERPARSGRSVAEHEILRIAATILGSNPIEGAEAARRAVLAWAQNRSGGKLPQEAWSLESFEHMSGGRNSAGVRLRGDNYDLWTIRADDPDKTIPGRIWTHEVTVGLMDGRPPRFSVRQLVNTAELDLDVAPHSPGFVRQVMERCGLERIDHEFALEPLVLSRDEELDEFLDSLSDPRRADPVFVLSVAEDAAEPLMDAASLARATMGLARVVVVPDRFTWRLSQRLGKTHSVFGGAVRAYLPGFSRDADPYAHRLFLATALTTPDARVRADRWMRSVAAVWSLRTSKLGVDVLAFSSIRNAALRARQEHRQSEGADAGELLLLAKSRIAALESDLETAENYQTYFDGEAAKERARAEAAEAQHRSSVFRIQQLEAALDAGGVQRNEERAPADWAEFANWCDVSLAGRLVLTPSARKGVKQPEFEDFAQAARCLTWLATTYRDGRMNGAAGDFRDVYLEEGVRNSPCGGDEYEFDWQGRRLSADWHVKSGGNTRDPKRALRIYYCWDEDMQQVIVSDMPEHRANEVS